MAPPKRRCLSPAPPAAPSSSARAERCSPPASAADRAALPPPYAVSSGPLPLPRYRRCQARRRHRQPSERPSQRRLSGRVRRHHRHRRRRRLLLLLSLGACARFPPLPCGARRICASPLASSRLVASAAAAPRHSSAAQWPQNCQRSHRSLLRVHPAHQLIVLSGEQQSADSFIGGAHRVCLLNAQPALRGASRRRRSSRP